MLQAEAEPNHTSGAPVPQSADNGHVNNAFEDGPQRADKVNDKKNVRIIIVKYFN